MIKKCAIAPETSWQSLIHEQEINKNGMF